MVSQSYYTRVGGKTNGPFSLRRLRQMASVGKLHPNDMLRMDGNAKSVKAENIEGLFSPSSSHSFSPATD